MIEKEFLIGRFISKETLIGHMTKFISLSKSITLVPLGQSKKKDLYGMVIMIGKVHSDLTDFILFRL